MRRSIQEPLQPYGKRSGSPAEAPPQVSQALIEVAPTCTSPPQGSDGHRRQPGRCSATVACDGLRIRGLGGDSPPDAGILRSSTGKVSDQPPKRSAALRGQTILSPRTFSGTPPSHTPGQSPIAGQSFSALISPIDRQNAAGRYISGQTMNRPAISDPPEGFGRKRPAGREVGKLAGKGGSGAMSPAASGWDRLAQWQFGNVADCTSRRGLGHRDLRPRASLPFALSKWRTRPEPSAP